jgi:hypothetical protein
MQIHRTIRIERNRSDKLRSVLAGQVKILRVKSNSRKLKLLDLKLRVSVIYLLFAELIYEVR